MSTGLVFTPEPGFIWVNVCLLWIVFLGYAWTGSDFLHVGASWNQSPSIFLAILWAESALPGNQVIGAIAFIYGKGI